MSVSRYDLWYYLHFEPDLPEVLRIQSSVRNTIRRV